MGELLREIRHGLRGWSRTPALTLVALAAIAVGIGANTIVFSIVHGVLIDPLPEAELDGLVAISAATADNPRRFGDANLLDVRQAVGERSLEAVAAARSTGVRITESDRPLLPLMRQVTADYFRVLGVEPFLGRSFRPEEDVPGGTRVTVLDYDFWTDYYGGDPAVLGRSIELLGEPWEIVGVMPAGHRDPGFPSQPVLYLPLALDPASAAREEPRSGAFLRVFGRLAESATLEQAQSELDRLAADLEALYPAENEAFELSAVPVRDLLGGSRAAGSLYLLMGSVVCVLLIACGNVANLLMARAVRRRREISIRLALGAGARRLVRQLTVEGVVLSGVGGVLGVLLAVLGLDVVLRWMPGAFTGLSVDQVEINSGVLAFSLALTLGAGLVFGLVPALRALGDQAEGLSAGAVRSVGSRRSRRGRQLLVVAEIAVSLALLVGAGLTVQSFQRLSRLSTGLDPTDVHTFRTSARGDFMAGDEGFVRFHESVRRALEQRPGIESVGNVLFAPLQFPWQGRPTVIDGEGDATSGPQLLAQSASKGYFDTLGIPLLAGRDFDERDRLGGEPVVIVNRAAAERYWPGGDALGGVVRVPHRDDVPRRVVGIVGNVRDVGETPDPKPEVYLPSGQFSPVSRTYMVKTRLEGRELAGAIREAVWSVHADAPVYAEQSMARVVDDRDWQTRFVMRLLAAFALLALALAASGVYGVLSYLVNEERREIGVRMAVGARRVDVLTMVLGRALRPTAVGLLVGLGGGALLAEGLRGMLFGVAPFEPFTYLSVAMGLLVVALAAATIPALRATRVDPVRVLQEE